MAILKRIKGLNDLQSVLDYPKPFTADILEWKAQLNGMAQLKQVKRQ